MNDSIPLTGANGILVALARSKFRGRIKLKHHDVDYINKHGLDGVMQHARKFLVTRLFPAVPVNDGKQTPMRGHPVFIAQHATATCCRRCLAKWHHIPTGCALTETEQSRVLALIRGWLEDQVSQMGSMEIPLEKQAELDL